MDGQLQFIEEIQFMQITDTRLLFTRGKILEIRRGHEDKWTLDTLGPQFFFCGKPVPCWHAYITDDDVRLKEDGRLNELLTVTHRANAWKAELSKATTIPRKSS